MEIRDFIYLDVDRLKSIIAQIEKGFVETSSETKATSAAARGGAEGGVLGILKITGGTDFLWQKQETETRTLHDYMYIKVEEALLQSKDIVQIPGDVTPVSVENGQFADAFRNTSFVLARGRVAVNDFHNMRQFLERFNQFAEFIAFCSSQNQPGVSSEGASKHGARRQAQAMRLDKRLVDGLKLTFDLFYSERIAVRLTPFPELPDFRLVGDLNNRFLRDSLASITYKYGSSPVSEWTVFAQIAAIPPEKPPDFPKPIKGSPIDIALQSMFDAYRDLERMSQSVAYPEISITPIAIYRGWGSEGISLARTGVAT